MFESALTTPVKLRVHVPADPALRLPRPADADLIAEALVAARDLATDESGDARRRDRRPVRATAALQLLTDNPEDAPWALFARDADPRNLGFLTEHPLPVGHGGRVRLATADGQTLDVGCTIYRCRECVPGWYEGALSFHKLQPALRVA